MTDEEILEAKKRITQTIEKVNSILIAQKQPPFTMTEQEIDALARDPSRALYHSKSVEIKKQQTMQREQYLAEFGGRNIPTSFNRSAFTYYKVHDEKSIDSQQERENRKQINLLADFSQEGIDAQIDFSMNTLKEIASFDPSKWSTNLSPALFEKAAQNPGLSSRMFEAQNIYAGIQYDFSVDPTIAPKLKDRVSAMVAFGGFVDGALTLFSDENSIYFPFEKLNTEQLAALMSSPDQTYADTARSTMNFNLYVGQEVKLKDSSPIRINPQNVVPKESLIYRATGIEDALSGFSTGHHKYGDSINEDSNIRPEYRDLLQSANMFRDRFAPAVSDPENFDFDSFLRDYKVFNDRAVELLKNERQAKNSYKGKDEYTRQVFRDNVEFLEAVCTKDLSQVERRMRAGIKEQVQKNAREKVAKTPIDKDSMKAELNRFRKEFKKADGLFFTPKDPAYTEFARALNAMPSTLDGLDAKGRQIYNVNTQHLRDLYAKGDAFLASYQGKTKLTDTDIQRLKTVNRVMDYIEFSQEAAKTGNPDLAKPNFSKQLAGKLSDALVSEFNKDPKKQASVTVLMTNRSAREASIKNLQEQPAFTKMVDNYANDLSNFRVNLTPNDLLLRQKGSELTSMYKKARVQVEREMEASERQKQQEIQQKKAEAIQEKLEASAKALQSEKKKSGPNTKVGHLFEQYREGLRTIHGDLQQMHRNPNAKCASSDGLAFSKALALQLIQAERASLNGPDYNQLDDFSKLKRGPLEQCLETYGSNAFIRAVQDTPVMKGLVGEDGIPKEAIKELAKVDNRRTLAADMIKSASMKDLIQERAQAHRENALKKSGKKEITNTKTATKSV